MDINLTSIIAILAIVSMGIFSYSGKLKGFIEGFKKGHDKEQDKIKEKVEETKKEIIEKDKKIKELEEKSEKAKEIIEKISESNNEEVKKILKETDAEKLMEEFEKW